MAGSHCQDLIQQTNRQDEEGDKGEGGDKQGDIDQDPGDPYPVHRDDFFWKSGTQWLRAKVLARSWLQNVH